MATKISDLLIANSGCGDVALTFDGTRLNARYEIRRGGKDQIGQVTFASVRAFRFRNHYAVLFSSNGYLAIRTGTRSRGLGVAVGRVFQPWFEPWPSKIGGGARVDR